MDRIALALKKNRERRRGSIRDASSNRSEKKTPSSLEKIPYTKTRQVIAPQHILAENRIIAGNQSDPRAAAFKILRTQVLHEMRKNKWSTLAVTGPVAGIGKSTVAANLAASISLEVNQTVLLVDLDLRRPSLHRYFGVEPEYGILDYIESDVPLENILVNPTFERLVLLPGKGTSSASSELLSSPRMIELIKELRNRYASRIVIFDLPPLLNLADAMVFLPNVDSSILVIENGKNTESDVTKSLRLLASTNLIGTVLNKSDDDLKEYY